MNSGTIEQRMQQMEQAIVAGVANGTLASNEADDTASELTGNRSTGNAYGTTGSASGYLRQRRNTHNNGGGNSTK